MKKNLTLRALTEGAIFVALAQVISYLKLFELPQGGSITVAMLPIFLYCARWGFGPGLLASFVVIHCRQGDCQTTEDQSEDILFHNAICFLGFNFCLTMQR